MITLVFGLRTAIPILTVAQLIGNGSRGLFNRRQVDGAVVGWLALDQAGRFPAATALRIPASRGAVTESV